MPEEPKGTIFMSATLARHVFYTHKYSPTMKDQASVRLGGGKGWGVVRDSKQLRLLSLRLGGGDDGSYSKVDTNTLSRA